MLIIEDIHREKDGRRIEAHLELNGKPFELFFESPNTMLAPRLEGLLAMTLTAAMSSHCGTVRARGSVSPEFLQNLYQAQELLVSWRPSYQRATYEGIEPVSTSGSGGTGSGVFFSLGLDSYYSLLKNLDEITHIIFIHGYDLALHDQQLRQRSTEAVHRVASHFGKQVIEIETNARTFLEPLTQWVWSYGPTLACIGYLLSPHVHRLYIAASHTYKHNPPQGTHVDLDPHWNSPGLEFIHDGLESGRVQKARLIGKYEVALQTLRVCNNNPNNQYNCGRCYKCVRTMAALQAAGVLDRCTTFDKKLDMRQVARIDVYSRRERLYLEEILDEIKDTDREPELAQAITEAMNKPAWRGQLLKTLRKTKARLVPRRRFQD